VTVRLQLTLIDTIATLSLPTLCKIFFTEVGLNWGSQFVTPFFMLTKY